MKVFFFQAEDGIRDGHVTGVQTCALPILRFSRVLEILKGAGVRMAVVYHDVEPFAGTRIIDLLRRQAQLRSMRHAMELCDVAVFTVPIEKLAWMRPQYRHSVFIPVGANLPVSREAASRKTIARRGKLKIAVFSVTGGSATQKEIGEIVGAVRFASSHVGNLQLTVLGSNPKEPDSEFIKLFDAGAVANKVLVLPWN